VRSSKRILVVDDDAHIALSLEIRLQADGWEVETQQTGDGALRAAQAAAPDVILLDVSIPDMDGFTLAERLRESAATRHTPLVFLTASKHGALRERARSVGAADFFEKPYDSTALLSRVGELLGQQAPSR